MSLHKALNSLRPLHGFSAMRGALVFFVLSALSSLVGSSIEKGIEAITDSFRKESPKKSA